MSAFQAEAEAAIGKQAWSILKDTIDKGLMTPKQMTATAKGLGDRVYGNHMQRQMVISWFMFSWNEFRKILSDWYIFSMFLYEKNQQKVLQTVIDTLDENEHHALINKLKTCFPGQGGGEHDTGNGRSSEEGRHVHWTGDYSTDAGSRPLASGGISDVPDRGPTLPP